MKSILFFNEGLDYGGCETILTNIISNINKNKYNITVVSEVDKEHYTDIIKSQCKYHSFVKKSESRIIKFLNSLIIKFSLVANENAVRKLLIRGHYDIEIAFCEGYATKIIGNSNSNAKKIAWIHTDVINYPWSEKIYGSSEDEKRCYEKFDAIICISETIKDAFVKKYGMENKIHIIYNPIDFDNIICKSLQTTDIVGKNGFRFILSGSIKQIKGYDRLVKIVAQLRDNGYKFSVLIMGSGVDRPRIDSLIKEYDISDIITILEYQQNPWRYMRISDAFVCSSYAEGYSTAVSEAVMLNIPVITTECSGMREIFGDRECGIICENSEEGLYNAMKKVLDNPLLLDHFREEENIRSKDFSMTERISKVEEFIDKI